MRRRPARIGSDGTRLYRMLEVTPNRLVRPICVIRLRPSDIRVTLCRAAVDGYSGRSASSRGGSPDIRVTLCRVTPCRRQIRPVRVAARAGGSPDIWAIQANPADLRRRRGGLRAEPTQSRSDEAGARGRRPGGGARGLPAPGAVPGDSSRRFSAAAVRRCGPWPLPADALSEPGARLVARRLRS